MKKVLISLFLSLSFLMLNAQEQNYSIMMSQQDDGTCMYMRSSLEMVYIDSDYFPNKELVDASWNNFMDPDRNSPSQYNKHYANIGVGSLPVDPENEEALTKVLT